MQDEQVEKNVEQLAKEFEAGAASDIANDPHINVEVKDESDQANNGGSDVVDEIPLDDVLGALAPGLKENLAGAPEWLAFQTMAKDLNESEKTAIRDCFRINKQTAELRTEVARILIRKHFPNWNPKISPELIMAVSVIVSVQHSVSAAKSQLAEMRHLKLNQGGKSEQEKGNTNVSA